MAVDFPCFLGGIQVFFSNGPYQLGIYMQRFFNARYDELPCKAVILLEKRINIPVICLFANEVSNINGEKIT